MGTNIRVVTNLARRLERNVNRADGVEGAEPGVPDLKTILKNDISDCFVSIPENTEKLPMLGCFTPPNSPPVIQLFEKQLNAFFVCSLEEVFGKNWKSQNLPIRLYSEVVVYKTFYHELFHFYSWYVRKLISNLPKDDLLEEALATACSWHQIHLNFFSRSEQTVQDRVFLDCIYNYSGAGYKDWRDYELKKNFQDKVLLYFFSSSIPKYEYPLIRNPETLLKNMVHWNLGYTIKI